MPTEIKKSNRGGKRPGAGRPSKTLATKEISNASFDAGWRYNTGRAFILTSGIDAKKELQGGTRKEILRRALYLINNVGMAGGAVGKVASLVGPLRPQARSNDPDWNRSTEEAFNHATSWSPGVDVSAQVNYSQAIDLIVRQMAIAGDVFWQAVKAGSGRGMFRLIPGENVDSGNASPDEGWQDGVKVNSFGRPIAYRVLQSPNQFDKYTDISADDLRQVRMPYRIGYTRSPSWLAHACGHFQDYAEYLGYEKTSAKLGAQMGVVITSAEAGRIAFGSGGLTNTTGINNQPLTIDSMMNGSVIPQLKPGEKLESFVNNHPAGNFEQFIKVIMRDIAVGFKCSPEFLFDMNAGGAAVRWMLEEASVMISKIQDILISQFCAPFWRFWVWNEIEAGRIKMPNDGSDWWKVEFIGPSDLSVDFGRDGRLMSDLLLRGQISPQRFYGLQGLDADKQDEDIIRFAASRKKLVKQIAKEEGVELTVSEVFPPAPGAPVPVTLSEGSKQGA